MSGHPGLPVSESGRDAFFSDENLMKRAVAADASDYALAPGEDASRVAGESPFLRSHGVAPVLQLAEIEVDSGSSGEGEGLAFTASESMAPSTPVSGSPGLDDLALDRLADMLLERMQRNLGGNS